MLLGFPPVRLALRPERAAPSPVRLSLLHLWSLSSPTGEQWGCGLFRNLSIQSLRTAVFLAERAEFLPRASVRAAGLVLAGVQRSLQEEATDAACAGYSSPKITSRMSLGAEERLHR